MWNKYAVRPAFTRPACVRDVHAYPQRCWARRTHVALLSLLGLILLTARPARAQTLPSKPDLYLLAVGVSAYGDARVPPLKYADDDARSMEAWAQRQEGRIYGRVHTRTLLNEQASRKQLLKELVEFYRPARQSDQLILFIAGHGVVEQDTGAYHFLTHDTEVSNILGTALEQRDILLKLEAPAQVRSRVLVLIDTCHSGSLVDIADQLSKNARGGFLAGDAQQLADRHVASKAGLWAILSAGTAADLAEEGPRFRLPDEPADVEGHGLFTHALLGALGSTAADRDRNGAVTMTELVQHVTSTVTELSGGKQFPSLSGKVMDTAIAYAVGSVERCDGTDNDFDGEVDEGFEDRNRNGLADCLEQEICNGIDDNGDGQIDEGFDLDLDGYRSLELCGSVHGSDCDDGDIAIHPEQKDWGNLRDDDCDGLVDEEDFDFNQNGVPDLMEGRADRLSQRRWVGYGVGTALLAASLGSYLQVYRLQNPGDAGDETNKLPPEAVQRYQGFSHAALYAGVGGVVALSAGGYFHLENRRLKVTLFPRKRSASAQSSGLESTRGR